MCSDLYIYFLTTIGKDSYYPSGASEVSDNRLFGMYHSSTPTYNKEVILKRSSWYDKLFKKQREPILQFAQGKDVFVSSSLPTACTGACHGSGKSLCYYFWREI